ncbi:MAG: hypothetical protein HZA64_01135 [Rhodocyclales bacterium]|nr:hypothetical protein [Rhodocyclales bacterium]
MNLSDVFHKTAKGEEEIAHRGHGLAPRARSLLIMVNGKITGDELQKRAESLGGGGALFAMLVEGGFIEPTEARGDTLAAAVPAPAQFGPAHAEAIKFASHFIVEALGPAYDELGGRVEACRDPAKLAALLESVRDVIEGNAGRKKADAFWAGVTARLA